MKYKLLKQQSLLDLTTKSQIRKLLKTFQCSKNEDLEDFIHNKAITFELNGRSRTYLLIDIKDKKLMGYFSISITTLDISSLSNEIQKLLYGDNKIKNYYIPCYLIGQLGKSDICKNKIGKKLLKKSIEIIYNNYLDLNGRFILIDAFNNEKLINFYKQYDFTEIEQITPKKESIKMIYWLV